MNLFRVLASGKRGLNEENMSACLAWLLHPGMDHGFGPAFLKAFLAEIGSHAEAADAQFQGELARLGERIKYRLRSNSEDDLSIDVELEHNAGGQGFVDVLVSVNDDWVIAIENKISAASAQDSTQLLGQYRGLCDEACAGQPEPASPEGRRLMVFLVPPHSLAQAEEDFERSVLAEWNELQLGEMHRQDGKVLVSWRRRNGRPSIENVITRMLGDELDGEIEPLHDQTRHTLLALRRFISGDFEGYPFSRKKSVGGANPATEKRIRLSGLAKEADGFVGIAAGLSGLLRHLKDAPLDSRDFQFTRQDMSHVQNWLPARSVLAIAAAAQAGFPDIGAVMACAPDGKLSLPGDLLLWLAEQPGKPGFHVGIQGGAASLAAMSHRDVQGRKWGISTQAHTKQWIDSATFARLYRQARDRLA